jgi:hypothetical protein
MIKRGDWLDPELSAILFRELPADLATLLV